MGFLFQSRYFHTKYHTHFLLWLEDRQASTLSNDESNAQQLTGISSYKAELPHAPHLSASLTALLLRLSPQWF